MKLPKVRITLDLEHELFEWVMRKVEKTGNSRNSVIGEIIQKAMEDELVRNKLFTLIDGTSIPDVRRRGND